MRTVLFLLISYNFLFAEQDSLKVEELYSSGIRELRINPKNSYNYFKEALSIIDDVILLKKRDDHYFLLKKL